MKKLILILFAFLLSTSIFAGPIKQIVVLGDSLSDNGNLYRQMKIVPKSPPYYEGRFTNGPTWAEHVGNFFYNKSFVDVKNYAVGGATSIWHSPIHDAFLAPITLTTEIYDYSSKSLFTNKNDILYIIWIGANDYLYENEPNQDFVATQVTNNIAWAVNYLANEGARNFIILNLPDLSKTPYAKENKITGKLYNFTQLHNQKLAATINKLKTSNPALKIQYIDVYSVFNDLLANPEKYNQQYNKHITDITTACWKGGMMLKNANTLTTLNDDLKKSFSTNEMSLIKNFDTSLVSNTILNSPSLAQAYAVGKLAEQGITPCANADEHIFWDEIHPTETVHQILAAIVETQMTSFNI